MRSLKLTLAYDGTAYAGWQIQPDRPTLQGTLEQALHRITGENIRAVASGRTDTGVHAQGQVVSLASECRLSVDKLQRAINANLPRDMRVLQVEEAPRGFHAIRDAVSKRYRYIIQQGPVADVFARRYSWFVPFRLDRQAMHRAAQGLVGTHDFASFQAAGGQRCSSVRTVTQLAVTSDCLDRIEHVCIEIDADGFLFHMVRNIVGTLVEVGKGARSEDWPTEVQRARDRRRAGRTAPAHGLFLVLVRYGNAEAGSSG